MRWVLEFLGIVPKAKSIKANRKQRKNAKCQPQLEALEDRQVPASSFLSMAEFAGATQQLLYVPGTGAGAGNLYVSQDAQTGDVSVAYEQDLSVNDNTYGVNAIGWSGGHKFNDLVGSDKARFQFWDSTGKVVLDFYLDYVSLSSTAPSGYASLGALGGDGRMVLGSAGSVLDWDTGQAFNLNYFRKTYGSLTVNGVNLMVDSPAADSNFQALDQATFGAWNYHDWFRVRISGQAFGSAGFGGVAVVDQHNSPSKIGDNSFIPQLDPNTPETPLDSSKPPKPGHKTKDAKPPKDKKDAKPPKHDSPPGPSDESNLASLSGYVFWEVNGNNRDSGDIPLAGVTLNLTGMTTLGKAVNLSVTTDANGFYCFKDLEPGTYAITEIQPMDFANAENWVGTVNGIANGNYFGEDQIGNIVLKAGDAGLNYNFGELQSEEPGT